MRKFRTAIVFKIVKIILKGYSFKCIKINELYII